MTIFNTSKGDVEDAIQYMQNSKASGQQSMTTQEIKAICELCNSQIRKLRDLDLG